MRHLYRGGVLVACLVVCFAIAGGAAAAPSIPVSVAASVDSFTSDIGCCVEPTLGDPYTVVVPRLGRLTAVADLDVCGDSCEPDGQTIFSIQFTAPAGGMFILIGAAGSGSLNDLSGSGTWSVLRTGPFAPTGRFANIAGSGTWSAAVTLLGPHVDPNGPPGTDSILTLSVAGTLTLRGR
ncbi:MAG: hypothetical protein E6G50_05470 [Actinobacteria bacterium]|nr:MAG: hypothetical protein E6G50_05470 [Actinomycetota bacterium]